MKHDASYQSAVFVCAVHILFILEDNISIRTLPSRSRLKSSAVFSVHYELCELFIASETNTNLIRFTESHNDVY